jgi:hypothetical protein
VVNEGHPRVNREGEQGEVNGEARNGLPIFFGFPKTAYAARKLAQKIGRTNWQINEYSAEKRKEEIS